MLKLRNLIFAILFLYLSFDSAGQHEPRFNFPIFKTSPTTVSVKGYFRFMTYHRHLYDLFGDSSKPYVFRADDEFNSPSMNLELKLFNKKAGYVKTQ